MIIQNKDSEMDSINDEDTVEEESNDTNRTVNHRKVSLALTPEDEPLDLNRGTQEIKYGFLLPPTRTPPKLLLVFPKKSTQQDTKTSSAEKLAY
jgi:hypothetical protein